MKKVLLINPPLYFSDGIPYSIDTAVPPLGLLCLASYINEYSDYINIEVLDIAPYKISVNELKAKLHQHEYMAFGITSMTPQLQGAVETAKVIRQEVGNDIPIFLGGSHISSSPNFLTYYENIFDYGITGEAEKTFLESLHSIMNGKSIPKIQQSEIIANFDSVPFDYRGLLDRSKYQASETVLYSRGCPFKCYYCSRPAIDKKIRYRSLDNIIQQLTDCYEQSKGYIDFQDDTFTINRKKVIEFCQGIKETGLKFHWMCNTRIDLVDEELLSCMSDSGCYQINFGVESGNERIRKEIIKKGQFTNEQVYQVFGWCRKHKIEVGAYFMLGHPTETKAELEDTKKMVLNAKIDILGLSISTPFPGSQLYDIAKNENIINEQMIIDFAEKRLGEGYAGIYPVYVPKGMTHDYLLEQIAFLNRKFYLNVGTFWKRLKKDLTSFKQLKSDAKDFFALVMKGTSSRKPYVKKKSIKDS